MIDPITILKQLKHADDCQKYPNIKPSYIAPYNYTDKTANGLTRCVIDWINLNGHQAERINSMGRMIDESYEFTDVLGHRRKAGGIRWIKGTTTKGTADISATIAGRSVKVEVKVGKDRQRPDQVKYQQAVERAGGVYIIVKSFDEFYQWYLKFTEC